MLTIVTLINTISFFLILLENTFHSLPRREKMAHSHKKCGGCSLCPRRFTFHVTDRGTARIKMVRKSLVSYELAIETK